MSALSLITILIAFTSFISGVESDTSSDTSSDLPNQCPARCEVLKELDIIREEMQNLRLMQTQESILRMSLVQDIQRQSKKIDNLDSNVDTINKSLSDQADAFSKRTTVIAEELSEFNRTLVEKTTEGGLRSDDLAKSVDVNYRNLQQAMKTLNESISETTNDFLNNVSDSTREHNQSIRTLSVSMAAMERKILNHNNELQNERSHRIKAEINFEKSLEEIRKIANNSNQHLGSQETKIAFSATGGKRHSGKIIYEKILINLGNSYSTSTGIFTTPLDGTYVFSWTVATDDQKNCDTDILVNNISKASNLVESGTTKEDNSGSQSIIIYLNRSDQVFIKQSTCDYIHSSWSSFSGFRYT